MYITSDIAIASFLMMKGLKLISAEKEKNGRFKFTFDDKDSMGQQLSVEFLNSESAKFDAHVKNLKNILFQEK